MADEVVVQQVPVGPERSLATDAEFVLVGVPGQFDVLPVARSLQIQVARIHVEALEDGVMGDGQQLDAVAELVSSLEGRLISLSARVDELAGRAGFADLTESGGEADTSADAVIARALETGSTMVGPISAGMVDIIRQVASGHVEEAQRMLRAMPEEELSSQPAVVTLVAAALFIQRGDLQAGIRSLEHARTLTEDKRLTQIIDKVERQVHPD